MNSPIIQLDNVSLKMPDSDKQILSNIRYQVNYGDFIVILGSNGSGKSSLLKLLDRRYEKTSGKITLNNKPIADYSNAEFSKTVITLTQNCHESLFTSLTLFENYLLVKQKEEKNLFSIAKKSEKTFFADYLASFNANLATKIDTLVEKLSGGEKQALALALSVLYPPQVLLLDEHTSALDPKSAEQLMELTHQVVTKNKITCLLTTHDLDVAKHYGNRILALRHGHIFQVIDAEEKPAMTQQELLAACY